MDCSSTTPLRIGDWRVDATAGQISREGDTIRVEARTMRLLLCLADRAGEVVSIDELLEQVWAGVVVTPDSVYQAVALLRRMLGDDARRPAYIVTVPRLGYRLVAPVTSEVDVEPNPEPSATSQPSVGADDAHLPRLVVTTAPIVNTSSSPPATRRTGTWLSVGAALVLALIGAFLFHGKVVGDHAATTESAPQRSVAVLPFLDLTTQEMNEEYFADGMTEELIDRLSKVPGFSVPPPTSSFYFKGKKTTVADIAKSLAVVYVLDGSIRKSGTKLRIAARLVRAGDGYVIWSETYDRPSDDRLWVQEDIANEVTKALRAAIN